MAKNKITSVLKESFDDLDVPLEDNGYTSFLKRGKLQIRIIYEDKSYKDFYKKFGTSYIITIKKKDYLVIPECICRGKNNSITFYFNNPMPINYQFTYSELTAKDLYGVEKLKELIKTNPQKAMILAKMKIDSEGLHAMFNTNLLKGLYALQGMTPKTMLIIAVAVFVMLLVILQVTGQVDVIGMISGATVSQ